MPSVTERKDHLAALAVVSAVVLLYSVIILQQILLGLILVLGFWFFYLFYLLVRRLGRIATAVEEIADQGSDRPTSDEFSRD
jgi:fatty acid desaturase